MKKIPLLLTTLCLFGCSSKGTTEPIDNTLHPGVELTAIEEGVYISLLSISKTIFGSAYTTEEQDNLEFRFRFRNTLNEDVYLASTYVKYHFLFDGVYESVSYSTETQPNKVLANGQEFISLITRPNTAWDKAKFVYQENNGETIFSFDIERADWNY